MHELGIAEEILKIVTRQAENKKAKAVTKVKIQVGEATVVEDSSLRFCFKELSKKTLAQGASLQIKKVPVRYRCPSCKKIFVLKNLDFLCPSCRVVSLRVVSGQELLVESIEIE